MAVSLKHIFVSNVADSPDATLVQPSNWNDEHTLTANTSSFLGTTANSTSVVEIAYTNAGLELLQDADAATQRTTLGLGTGDSPEFAGVNIGNASDTTITRVSAGVLAVEGNQVPSPGSVAQGDILYYNGSTWARLGAGTSGQALKSGGSSGAPTWGNVPTVYSQDSAPSNANDGDIWYDTSAYTLYMYADGAWSSVVTSNSNRGVFAGGYTGAAYSAAIQLINIAFLANATSFGNLTLARNALAGCSSETRGLFGGGFSGSNSNIIEYVSFSTTGNAIDFGDLSAARRELGSCSSSTRGVWAGGFISAASNTIDYVTIATSGNATDFGDLLTASRYAAGCSNGSRGAFAVGNSTNTIEYITIATTGNAIDFGDLTRTVSSTLGSCSNGTRGVWAGDGNVIEYVTIATAGNAIDFGDLTVSRTGLAGCSNGSRGVFGGGTLGGGSGSNVIDYIAISTTGNSLDFGDLSTAVGSLAACSGFYGA